jgi:hypothetical protein
MNPALAQVVEVEVGQVEAAVMLVVLELFAKKLVNLYATH